MPNEDIYGADYCSCGNVNSTGDVMLVTGLDNAKQAVRNQLLTRKGTYPSVDDEYGSLIYEVYGEDLTKPNLDALEVYVTNALLDQPRVAKIESINTYITIKNKIICNITVELVNGSEQSFNIEV